MSSICVPAKQEQLPVVQGFIEQQLETYDCSMKAQMQIDIAVEEIFVNIVSYAYSPKDGEAQIQCDVFEDPLRVEISFLDDGKPFDPLSQKEADISPDALIERTGGLGILMVKQTMDEVSYAYENGRNVLTIKKNL